MAASVSRGRGNTKRDQEWLDKAAEAGFIVEMSPEEMDDVPHAAKIQFTGDLEDEGSPWQFPGKEGGCKARSRVRDIDGDYVLDVNGNPILRPCMRWPIRGAAVCITHGGGAGKVINAAKLRMIGAADMVTGALVAIALDNRVAHRDRISAINSVMDRVGLRSGVEVAVEVKPWQALLDRLQGESGAISAVLEAETGDVDD